ncbi:MAG: TAXI family TRAP transporter solute-binding subunit [Planctomycetes bacterium]|nr:TAXI family TRAP transporter solute-binding subunit [Planctomycetota bacterium]
MRLRLLVPLVVILLGGAAACAIVWFRTRETLPPEIRIAAGKRDGLYFTFAEEFAKRLQERTGRPVRVVETAGSEENVGLLRDGSAELALIQSDSPTPNGTAGVAPLFPEPLHFIVRKTSKIRSPADLAPSRRVALGLKGSAIRQNAFTVLAHYDIPAKNFEHTEDHFVAIATDKNIEATIVTTGWMNPLLEQLLRNEELELIDLPDPEGLAMRHPWFAPVTIPSGLYHGKTPLPVKPVRTVAVTALLAGRSDAPDPLVREALATLYETNLSASYPAMLPAKAAKEYSAAVMHPAVAKYHDPSVAFRRLSQAMELLSKSKEAIFGVVAGAVVVWSWVRRRREQAAAKADRIQKQKLEGFIDRTLAVELEQMDVTEPEELRAYLRQVTFIKQEALKELTSDKVRGDQLFAIFLSQCAALSEKIQMRMIYARVSEARVSETRA